MSHTTVSAGAGAVDPWPTVDVAIIGGGPAGLAAGRVLGRTGRRVVVLEREQQAGGIPRHSSHVGYGMRDRRTFTTGPSYARQLVAAAREAGAEVWPGTMATDWADERSLWLTSPRGRTRLNAGAVLLATGARERPRAARMIPGDRPAGVYTTGELQNAVHLHHQHVGSRAVVIGAELVSWSAVLTLREAGCSTALMVTSHDTPESYAAFNVVGRLVLRTPMATGHGVIRILGRRRVEGVEVVDLRTGVRRVVACDTVVTTGNWVPDHELGRTAGATMDPGTRGPMVDPSGRTDRTGLFAAGNVVHPVDTADVAALGGAHVARAITAYLTMGFPDTPVGVPVMAGDPFAWVAPGRLAPGPVGLCRGQLQSWVTATVRFPRVTARQDGRVVGRIRTPWPASPGRVFRIPGGIVRRADPYGGPVELTL